MRKDALSPIVEQIGNTASKVGEAIGQSYVINSIADRYSKPIIKLLMLGMVGLGFIMHRFFIFIEGLVAFFEDGKLEKAISDSPIIVSFVLIFIILAFWIMIERVGRERS